MKPHNRAALYPGLFLFNVSGEKIIWEEVPALPGQVTGQGATGGLWRPGWEKGSACGHVKLGASIMGLERFSCVVSKLWRIHLCLHLWQARDSMRHSVKYKPWYFDIKMAKRHQLKHYKHYVLTPPWKQATKLTLTWQSVRETEPGRFAV